ncbi:hypothetical protein U9M48_003662 [Paspalum notatum var. saurae]|uniref:Uncharacterized protein n=1 Tax=Paspalum notatum var. saurae TaxID=547442 RepID=A0AAQ3PIT0_PASNO
MPRREPQAAPTRTPPEPSRQDDDSTPSPRRRSTLCFPCFPATTAPRRTSASSTPTRVHLLVVKQFLVLEINWMTTSSSTEGDEMDDDHSHEGRTTEDHGASLKDACGDGPEGLLSTARLRFLLDLVLMDLYRLRPLLYKCNFIRSCGCDTD